MWHTFRAVICLLEAATKPLSWGVFMLSTQHLDQLYLFKALMSLRLLYFFETYYMYLWKGNSNAFHYLSSFHYFVHCSLFCPLISVFCPFFTILSFFHYSVFITLFCPFSVFRFLLLLPMSFLISYICLLFIIGKNNSQHSQQFFSKYHLSLQSDVTNFNILNSFHFIRTSSPHSIYNK